MDGALKRARDGWSKALEGHPFNTVDDLLAEIERDHAQWWQGEKSDLASRLYDNGVLELGPSHGDRAELIDVLVPRAEAWGRAAGAKEVFIQSGREGVARVLRSHGYEVAAVILRKKL